MDYADMTNAELIRELDRRGIDRTSLRKHNDYEGALVDDDARSARESAVTTAVEEVPAAAEEVEVTTVEVAEPEPEDAPAEPPAAEEVVAPEPHGGPVPEGVVTVAAARHGHVIAGYPSEQDLVNRFRNASTDG